MKHLLLLLFFISFTEVQAGSPSISHDLSKQHDLVAIVKVISINSEYNEAVNVLVERVIYRYGEATNENTSVNIVPGDEFILVGSQISPILKDRDGSRAKRISSISSVTCYRFRDYKVGVKLRLFARQLRTGFYKNSACALTRAINEDT